MNVSVRARNLRWERAAATVLAQYEIDEREVEEGWRVFSITGGSQPYEVRVHGSWADAPRCSCPDASNGYGQMHNAGYCKHIIAVLLKHDDLQYQLLELFL
jgi:uncharacterized Zn finger protein